ncbi:MAG: MFS transporter, partial [Gammaproteobacteria bacterium]|nr:MFS transporter [Gammaproteobacteria bacterium]
MSGSPTFSRLDGLRYGLLGLPLAFVALPLYVLLPNHYARAYGVSLAALGGILLAARLVDAVIDPLLGRLTDRLFGQSVERVLAFGMAAAVVLLIGFSLLFFPQWLVDPSHHVTLLALAAVLLTLTYAGYSALSIAHQSWGAMLGGDDSMRSRVVGWREGFGLVGVVVASVVPIAAGLSAMLVLFAVGLLAGLWFWTQAPRPVRMSAPPVPPRLHLPFRRAPFRRLLTVFVLNGIASAIPATLVLFFVQDRLQAPRSMEPAFLGLYFVFAAASIPLWLRAVRHFGLARTWLAGMVLSILVFAWAAVLHAGDAMPFLVVCALSGIALGTDLV